MTKMRHYCDLCSKVIKDDPIDELVIRNSAERETKIAKLYGDCSELVAAVYGAKVYELCPSCMGLVKKIIVYIEKTYAKTSHSSGES